MAGYCLYKSMPYHVFFFLIGDGGTGKGVFLRILQMLLGNRNIAAVPLHDLLNPRNDYDLASLRGKMANLAGEVTAKDIEDFSKVKTVTGGDIVKARLPYQKPFEFENYAKLIFAMNIPPKINDPTRGLRRRMKIIDFRNKVKRGDMVEDLEKEMDEGGELPGVMLWAVEGLKRLLENKEFTDSRTEAQTALDYRRKSDPVRYFADECIDQAGQEDPGYTLAASVMERYTEFAAVNNLPSVDPDKMKNDIIAYCTEEGINCEYTRRRLNQFGEHDQDKAKKENRKGNNPLYRCYKGIILTDSGIGGEQGTLTPGGTGLSDPMFRKVVRGFMKNADLTKDKHELTADFMKAFPGFKDSVGEEKIRYVIDKAKVGYKV